MNTENLPRDIALPSNGKSRHFSITIIVYVSILFLCDLPQQAAIAGYAASIRQAKDIDADRTHFRYMLPYYSTTCYDSETTVKDVLMVSSTQAANMCNPTAENILWPNDEKQVGDDGVGPCVPTGYNLSNQNGKPHVEITKPFQWHKQVSPQGSTCPANSTTVDEQTDVVRSAYYFCEKGWSIYVETDGSHINWNNWFCRLNSASIERDGQKSCAGNPIRLGTGKKYQKESDITSTTSTGVTLDRHYSSNISIARGLANAKGVFGVNWLSSYERRITSSSSPSAKTARVYRPNGDIYYFNLDNGSWINVSDIKDQLTRTATNWIYTTTQDTVEAYDLNGKLLSIAYLNGVSHVVGYDAQERLSSIVSTTGESLTFYYDPLTGDNFVDSVTDQAGRVWKYAYDPVTGNLTQVTYPDGTPGNDNDNPVRYYHYNDVNYPNALTSITDENGNSFAQFEYDTQGRAKASYHGPQTSVLTDRIDGITVAYSGTARTITNSNGQSTTYTLAPQMGVGLVSDITGPGCSSCSKSDTAYSYDSANNQVSETENNIVTKYGNYDNKGNYQCKVEGVSASDTSSGECAFDPAASPAARRTDYTYDSRYFSKVATISEPSVRSGFNRVTTYVYDDYGNRRSETIDGYSPDVQGGWTAVTRSTTWKYGGPNSSDCSESEAPFHQLCEIDGPRTDISDITLFRYYPDDPLEGNNRGRLKEVEDVNGVLFRSNIQYTATGKVASEDRPNGLSLIYTYYPGNDRLEAVTENSAAGNRITRWTYLATGEAESITTGYNSAAATTLTFGYDAARRLTRITDGLGNYQEYTLDTEGNRLSESVHDNVGALMKTLSQTFDAYNRLNVFSQANEAVDYNYATDGTLDWKIESYGIATDYSYDALKRLVQTTQDQGGWNPETANSMTSYSYDVADRLTQVVDPMSGATSYIYDDLGNLISLTSPDTGVTRYQYDAAGNRIQQTDAIGQVITYAYDALNRMVALDAPGIDDDVTNAYDSCTNGMGRLCTVIVAPVSATPVVTDYSYTAFGDVASVPGVTYSYDEVGRVISTAYPSGATVSYFYDVAGNITQVDLNRGGQAQTLASGIQYAPFGPMTGLTFGNGLVASKSFDQAYRASINMLGGLLSETYQFDPVGNLTEILDNMTIDHDRAFGYDALSRIRMYAAGEGVSGGGPLPPPAQGGTLFTNPPAIVIAIQSTNNESNATPGTYSKPWLTAIANNLVAGSVDIALERAEVALGTVSTTETVGYIAIENGVAGVFLAADNQAVTYESAISSDNITGWGTCYSAPLTGNYVQPPLVVGSLLTRAGSDGGWLRRCALSTSSIGLTVDEDKYKDTERDHTTEQAGLLAFSRPFNAQLTDYDGTGWALEAGEVTLNDTSVTPAFVSVSFQQNYSTTPVVVALPTNEGDDSCAVRIRNVTTAGFEISQVEPANYNGLHIPMTVPYIVMEPGTHQLPDGAWLVAGNVDISNVQHGSGVSGTASWHTLVFPDQPTSSAGGPGDIEYHYDVNGNRTQLAATGSSITDYAYTPASNRLTGYSGAQSAAVVTDANGNITAIGSRIFSHNAANRIMSVLDNGVITATYRYNGLGQRVEKTTAQGTTIYVYGVEGRLLGEYQPDGTLIREYVYLNGEPLAQLEPLGAANEVLYLHTDHLGTPRLATDAVGTAAWKWESDPFGAAAANDDLDGNGIPVTVNLRFPGQYYDQETGLHYNYFRYYDPNIGRYLTPEPLGILGLINEVGILDYTGGDTNAYLYALNNTLYYVDPDGEARKGKDKGKKEYSRTDKKKGAENRQPSQNRERNVGHPDAEEHSIRPKGGPRMPRIPGIPRLPVLICPLCDVLDIPQPEEYPTCI